MSQIKLLDIKYPEFLCLGWQMNEIFSLVEKYTKDCYWYVGDIKIYYMVKGYDNTRKNLYQIASKETKRFDNLQELKSLVGDVNQFVWGAFIAVPKNIQIDESKIHIGAEAHKIINIKEARVDIRAFDGWICEVYTSNTQIIETLVKKFNLQKEDIQSIE